MSSRAFSNPPSCFVTTERPKKVNIRRASKAQHKKTVSTENLVEKSTIGKPRETSLDNYGDGYTSSSDGENREADTWLSGFWRRIRILAVPALFMVPLCAGADAVILYKSDVHEVESWTFLPSVLLAVLSAVFVRIANNLWLLGHGASDVTQSTRDR